MSISVSPEFVDSVDDLADGDDFIPQRDISDSDVLEIQTIIAGGSCDVYWEHDPDDDGTYEVSVKVDDLRSGISHGNEIQVNRGRNVRLRIQNTSGGPADFAATGEMYP